MEQSPNEIIILSMVINKSFILLRQNKQETDFNITN